MLIGEVRLNYDIRKLFGANSYSHLDPSYAKTRAFYSAMSFTPLEEITTFLDEADPKILLERRYR